MRYLFVLALVSSLWPVSSQASYARGDGKPVEVVTISTEKGQAKILANSFGQALYVFDPDGTGTPKCAADCAEKWPPLLVTADEAKRLEAPLGVVARANGLLQVFYKGRPLYTFYLDRKVGDILGDGLGGVWHVVIVAERRFR